MESFKSHKENENSMDVRTNASFVFLPDI